MNIKKLIPVITLLMALFANTLVLNASVEANIKSAKEEEPVDDVEVTIIPGVYDGTLIDNADLFVVRCLDYQAVCAIIVKGSVINAEIDPNGSSIMIYDIDGYSTGIDQSGSYELTIDK